MSFQDVTLTRRTRLNLEGLEARVVPANLAPTVAQAAQAVVSPDGRSVQLSVLGADDGGEAALKYYWTVTPPSGGGARATTGTTFSAKSVRVNLSGAGTYTAVANITDAAGLSTTSTVKFTTSSVRQPELSVSRLSVTLNRGQSFDFDAVYRDQYSRVVAAAGTTAWSVVSGPGTVTAAGVFSSPTAGVTVLKAAADGKEATVTVVTRDPGSVPARTSHALGEQKVLVVQWVYADSPGTGNVPIDFATAASKANRADQYFRSMSFNKTGLNCTFVPVQIRLEYPKAYYQNLKDYTAESREALQRAEQLDPAFNLSNFQRYWYATKPTNLGSTGKASLGGSQLWIGIGEGQGYINHEFAHTYGVDHQKAGSDIGANISTPDRIKLGWLTATDANGFKVGSLTAEGTFRLHDENSTLPVPNGLRAIQTPWQIGAQTALGYNRYTFSFSSTSGNQTLWIHDGMGKRHDATPGSLTKDDWKDGGVPVGGSYVLPSPAPDGRKVRLTVLGLTPATATTPAALDVKFEFVAADAPPPPPANRPPVAANDTASTAAGTAVTVDALANDTDPDGDALTIASAGTPAHGTAAVSGGKVVYTPNAGFSGTDTFTYLVADGKGGSATGQVTVTVVAPPAPPPPPPPPPATAGTGLQATYWDNKDFTGPSVTRTDAAVNFNWGGGSPAAGIGADTFSVRWVGSVQAPTTGEYVFRTYSDDGIRVKVNGVLVIDQWNNHAARYDQAAPVTLTAGQRVSVEVEYYENTGSAVARLEWRKPGDAAFEVVPQPYLWPV